MTDDRRQSRTRPSRREAVKKDVKKMKKMLIDGLVNSKDYQHLDQNESMKALINLNMTE